MCMPHMTSMVRRGERGLVVERIRVTVEAADALSAALLVRSLSSVEGLDVVHVGAAVRGPGGVASPNSHVAVLDVDNRSSDVVELARAFMDRGESVVLIGHAMAPALVRRAVTAGVSGVMTKEADVDDLVRVVRRVARGLGHVDPTLAAAALRCADDPLTRREREVLSRIHHDATVAGIAEELHLAVGTVRNLLSSAIRKTGAPTRTQAATEARERGWI